MKILSEKCGVGFDINVRRSHCIETLFVKLKLLMFGCIHNY